MFLRAIRWCPVDAAFVGLTLIAAAVHFFDNAFRLDLYPGPDWLTRKEVIFALLVVFLLGCTAYRIGTRTALILYAVVGFGGLAHYLAPPKNGMPVRCTFTIFTEAMASVVLIAYALFSGSGRSIMKERAGLKARRR